MKREAIVGKGACKCGFLSFSGCKYRHLCMHTHLTTLYPNVHSLRGVLTLLDQLSKPRSIWSCRRGSLSPANRWRYIWRPVFCRRDISLYFIACNSMWSMFSFTLWPVLLLTLVETFAWLFCNFRCLFSKVPFLPPSWVPTILPQWLLRCCAASWYWCHLYACLLLFWLCSLTFVFVRLLVCCTAPRLGTVFVHVFSKRDAPPWRIWITIWHILRLNGGLWTFIKRQSNGPLLQFLLHVAVRCGGFYDLNQRGIETCVLYSLLRTRLRGKVFCDAQ